MHRPFLLACLALLAVAAAGCTVSQPNAPQQTYTGLERPKSEVAVVECGLSTRILAIDGDDSHLGQALRDRFSLLPGEHSFRVTLAPDAISAGEDRGEPRTVTFELKAGHVYAISVFAQPVDGRAWGVVVSDRTANADLIDPYLARQ